MITDIIVRLKEKDVKVWLECGELELDEPTGVLTEELLAELQEHKQAIIKHLQCENSETGPPANADEKPKLYKVFDDYADGRVVTFETKDEWDALVQHFYQLSLWKEKCG